MKILQPEGWRRPKGYSNGIEAQGRMVFVAGMIGWDADERIVSDDMVAQIRQALSNIVAVLAEANAGPTDLVRLTWFVGDRAEVLRRSEEIGVVYRKVIGAHYPAMSMVEVSGFMEPGAKVEIEATAVAPV